MKKQPRPRPKKKKRPLFRWYEKLFFAAGFATAGLIGGAGYLEYRMEQWEAELDETNIEETCVTVGEHEFRQFDQDTIMPVFRDRLTDIFEAVQNSPLGKQLYDIADEADLPVCYQDDKSKELEANAFLSLDPEQPYMGYSYNMIKGSKHGAAETIGHEFFHLYQFIKNTNLMIGYTNDTFADDALRLFVSEAAAATVGSIVLHQLDMSEEETVIRFMLNSDDRYNLERYTEFYDRYKDTPSAEDATILAAQDMMQHRLSGDVLYDGWRTSYAKRLYKHINPDYTGQEEGDAKIPDSKIYSDLADALKSQREIKNNPLSILESLTMLPNGISIMPTDITAEQILDAAQNSAYELMETYQLHEAKEALENQTKDATIVPPANDTNAQLQSKRMNTRSP